MPQKIKLDDLNVLAYNPRNITEENLDNLRASIKSHTSAIPNEERGDGFRLCDTITVNKQGNRIIGGHQRTKALRLLGQDWIHEDDIKWVDLTPDSAEEKALNYSLNDRDAQGEFDVDATERLLTEIKEQNEDLFSELNFSDEFMQQVSQGASSGGNLKRQTTVPKPPDKVWVLIGCPLDDFADLSEIIAQIEKHKTEEMVIVRSKT